MTRLARHATTTAIDAHAIDSRYETWIATQQTQTRDGYPTSTTANGPHGTDISNPTLNAATTNITLGTRYGPGDRIDWARRQYAGITQDWANLADRQRALLDFMRPDDRTDDTPLPPRCNGNHLPGSTIPITEGGWHDPTCHNDAELYTRADGSRTLRRNGLCPTCSKRYTRTMGTQLDTSGEPTIPPEVPRIAQDQRNPHPTGNHTPETGERK